MGSVHETGTFLGELATPLLVAIIRSELARLVVVSLFPHHTTADQDFERSQAGGSPNSIRQPRVITSSLY